MTYEISSLTEVNVKSNYVMINCNYYLTFENSRYSDVDSILGPSIPQSNALPTTPPARTYPREFKTRFMQHAHTMSF